MNAEIMNAEIYFIELRSFAKKGGGGLEMKTIILWILEAMCVMID